MLFFAHLGITLFTAAGINQTLLLIQKRRMSRNKTLNDKSQLQPGKSIFTGGMSLRDTLFCSLGSLLPDIIDKPIGHFLFRDFFGNNGRIFSHTLLFAALFLILAVIIYRLKKQIWGFYLAFGIFMHLVLDYLWQTPGNLLWPFLGWSFPKSGEYDWLQYIFKAFVSNPSGYWLEICGMIITFGFIAAIFRQSLKKKRKQS